MNRVLPHVGRRLNAGNELQSDVGDADKSDNRARDVLVPASAEDQDTKEDVDCSIVRIPPVSIAAL